MSVRERYCLVTVGATATFDTLIRAVLAPAFLRRLAKHGYTNLMIQFGRDGRSVFEETALAAGRNGTYGVKVQGFDLSRRMKETMRIASGVAGRMEGVVVCHAGTGSVLDAIRIGVPVVVVPNTTLLHNHQLEFAEQMAKMEYAVHGDIDDLPNAIARAELLRERIKTRPPPNSGAHRLGSGVGGILDVEMGIDVAGHIE